MRFRAFIARHRTGLLLTAILILAAGLRFYGLGTHSLWTDELASVRRSGFDDLSTVMREGVLTEIWPPAYHIFLHYVQKGFGNTEWVLRFPSAVAGVLVVFVMFLVGRRLYTEREGLIAAILTAVLHCPIFYSQEARA